MKRFYSFLSLLFLCSALVFAQAPQTQTKPDAQSQMGASCPMRDGQCSGDSCCKNGCTKDCCGKACAKKDGKMACTKDCCTTKTCKMMKDGKSCCSGAQVTPKAN